MAGPLIVASIQQSANLGKRRAAAVAPSHWKTVEFAIQPKPEMRWFRFRQASWSRWSRAADARRTSRSHGPKCCRL